MAILAGITRPDGTPFYRNCRGLGGNWSISLLLEGKLHKQFETGEQTICHGPSLSVYDESSRHIFRSVGPDHQLHSIWAIFAPRPSWHSLMAFAQDAPGAWSLDLTHVATRPAITAAFETMYLHCRGDGKLSHELAMNALERALLLAADHVLSAPEQHDPRIETALCFIQSNLRKKLDVFRIARAANLSESYFAHLFSKATGMSPMDYVEQLKLEEAKAMLLTQDLRVAEIARWLGYENQFHFSTRFRKSTGLSPLRFRQTGGTAQYKAPDDSPVPAKPRSRKR